MKKTKKPKIKEKKEAGIRDGIRGLGVMIERVDNKVSLVAEQYGDTKKDIGDIKKTLDSHTEMIGSLTVGLEVVKSDLGIVKKDTKTTKLDIEIIKTDIEFIKNSVKKKVDLDEFIALERRVALLEKHR